MTKKELRSMIRQMLHEELHSRKHLKESAVSELPYRELDSLVANYNSKYAGWNGWYPKIVKVTCYEDDGLFVRFHLTNELSGDQKYIFCVRLFEDFIHNNIEFDSVIEDCYVNGPVFELGEYVLDNIGAI